MFIFSYLRLFPYILPFALSRSLSPALSLTLSILKWLIALKEVLFAILLMALISLNRTTIHRILNLLDGVWAWSRNIFLVFQIKLTVLNEVCETIGLILTNEKYQKLVKLNLAIFQIYSTWVWLSRSHSNIFLIADKPYFNCLSYSILMTYKRVFIYQFDIHLIFR